MFVIFLVLLYRERLLRFAPAAAFGALCFILTLNILNVDAFIVRQNVKRYAATGEIEIIKDNDGDEGRRVAVRTTKLDLHYLFELSYDAVPGLIDFIDIAEGDIRTELLAELACEREKLNTRMQSLSWPSLHISRLHAQKVLNGISELLDEYTVTSIRNGWKVEVDGENIYCFSDFWD
jgi:hypothetical protein